MSDRVDTYRCRCGQTVTVLGTKRGKRIGVNRHPLGHNAFQYRDVDRTETIYVYGQHQPHLSTCTAPRPPESPRRYIR